MATYQVEKSRGQWRKQFKYQMTDRDHNDPKEPFITPDADAQARQAAKRKEIIIWANHKCRRILCI
jgi:hypothetical protein